MVIVDKHSLSTLHHGNGRPFPQTGVPPSAGRADGNHVPPRNAYPRHRRSASLRRGARSGAVALALAAATSVPSLAADAPPRFLVFDVVVQRASHVLRVDTVVVDDAAQVGRRAYRTRLEYRCGAGAWRTAFRTTLTGASVSRVWAYPWPLYGRPCKLRATVELGRQVGRSATLSRVL